MHRRGWFGDVAAYFIRSVLVCVCGAPNKTRSHTTEPSRTMYFN